MSGTTTKLVVVQPFGTYAKGDEITDPATVTAVMAERDSGYVVAVSIPVAQQQQGG